MKGWYLAGNHPEQYEHGIVPGETFNGKRVARLHCTSSEPDGFGTVMQMIAATEYRGRRVRFSGVLRPQQVDGWAGLWMRVDGPIKGVPLAFDNMQGRPLKDTTDWERHAVVLDVADQAEAIGFGVLLAGKGTVQVADFGFEVVSTDIPTTGPQTYAPHPQNLDLSED